MSLGCVSSPQNHYLACVRDLEVCLDPVEGGGGTPLWPARRVCVETQNASSGSGGVSS